MYSSNGLLLAEVFPQHRLPLRRRPITLKNCFVPLCRKCHIWVSKSLTMLSHILDLKMYYNTSLVGKSSTMTFCKIENWEKIRNDWFNLHCNGQDTKKSRCILYSQAFQPGAIQVIKSPFTIKMQRNCKFGILPKKKYFRRNGTKTIFGVMGRRRNGTSKLWEVTLQFLQSRKFF